ncbi:MAG: bacillithiol biosynthesis deacetylase BshB1 [Crocinitomicaceae bacterium]|nr:bacillithiol biosynthesis deacetylase BshB1 [Crocinitomicaceae bacterium]
MDYLLVNQLKNKVMVDIIAFGAHPDDVELSAGGTLIKHVKNGLSVGIVDLTMGEMGTRGNTTTRKMEAEKAKDIIGAQFRINLNLPDAFINISKESINEIVKVIRTYKPQIVLCNAVKDRHPDHGVASKLVSKSCFISGLKKFETFENNISQDVHRPVSIYHYIQDQWIDPDFIVDISDDFKQKIKAVMAFKSQFYDPESQEPSTPISSLEFLESIKSKANLLGRSINKKFGEGFTVERPLGIDSLLKLF